MNGYLQNGDFNSSAIEGDNTQLANNDMMMMGDEGLGGGMIGGQSLDEIVNQNAKVIRRQSMPQQYGGQQTDNSMTMMDFGATSPAGPMANFQFNPNAGVDHSSMMAGNSTPAQSQQPRSRHPSNAELSLTTAFADGSQSFNPMMNPASSYQSPAQPQSGYDMPLATPYVDSSMGMQMDFNIDRDLNNGNAPNAQQMNMYSQAQFSPAVMQQSPTQYTGGQTPLSARPQQQGSGSGSRTSSYGHVAQPVSNAAQAASRRQSLQNATSNGPAHGGEMSPNGIPTASSPNPKSQEFAAQAQRSGNGADKSQELGNASSRKFDGLNGPVPVNASASNWNPNNQRFEWEAPEGGWPSTIVNRPHMQTTYKNAYSSTGFDMLGVLMRVATRPNPEINIGSVDLSCAFVVCDAERDDCPIVYCSDNFERLTGYTKHMILGRNCRFLQSPDGNVESGKHRKYVDDDSVLYLKNMIALQRESQISLINYRRGGQPFMNLLTMIPIPWDTDQIKFFVGFQVDLVEQPNAVTNKNPDGSYAINYQRGVTMPRYVQNPPESADRLNLGQTVPRDEVSTIISTIGSGESDYARRMWDKVLLENTDDVIHVLSLKGLFQWISPSALRILEYEPGELVGTALSSVCHPSDIVPVTRELKDTSSGVSVNVVFRIRRKNSGYMWFEGNGSLHTEQGKGRKSIVLVGRERPVYTLSKSDLSNSGGIGENELWTKMSTSGMFLFVASNVRQLLDRQPEELIGVSIQSLMRADSKTEFGRILEHARNGKKASVKHELINRRGQVLSAFTTLYPGDATEGSKPTFVLAQTRLIKFTRGPTAQRTSIYPKPEHASPERTQSPATQPATQTSTPGPTSASGAQTPRNNPNHITTETNAMTFSGQQGLRIGHQDQSLASEDNLFDELKTTKSSSWQYEIRQLEKRNRMLAEEVQSLSAAKKKRKRRRGKDQQKDCANCHTRVTPEWRRGPSGQRDLCNSCGLRWAKINGRVSPRASSAHSAASDKASKASKTSASPRHTSSTTPNLGAAATNNNTSNPIKTESPANAQGGGLGQSHSTTPMDGVQASPRAVRPNPPEGHGASMEGAHGVPDRIEEGVEEG